MVTKNKRKKVKVRISRPKKSSEIDLKSAIETEDEEVLVAASKSKEKKEIKNSFRGGLIGSRKKEARSSIFTREEKDGGSKKSSVRKSLPKKTRKAGPQLNLYRKISFSFIILTFVLFAIIFYFSFIKVTITITPNKERISNNLIIDIYNSEKEAVGPGKIAGAVEKVEVKEVKNFKASGKEVVGGETTGVIKVINNYNKSQPLVATTRFLSPDNKLFRLKNTINVPAGGSVEAEVYADKPGPSMAIGPTKFMIPGLWAGLQDKIYGESESAMKYEEKSKKNITQLDIDNGIKSIRDELLKRAEKEVGAEYSNYDQLVYRIDENSVSFDVDGKVGEEKNEFSITMTADVTVVAFNDDAVKEMAGNKLASLIASDKKLIEFDDDNISYSLDNYNLNQGSATINVSFEGITTITSADEIIDREKIVGLTREQLDVYLDDVEQIESYEVSFSPAFIEKVPDLADQIKIKVRD